MLASNNPFREAVETKTRGRLWPNPDREVEAPAINSRDATNQETLEVNTPSDATNITTYILNPNFKRNLNITVANSPDTIFYAKQTSSFTTKPDLVLHAGKDDKAPIIGVAKVVGMYKSNKVGLGDPAVEVGPDRIVWEDLRRLKKWSHSTHGFEWGEKGDRRKYEWRRLKEGKLDTKPEAILVEDGTRELAKGEHGPEVLARLKNVKLSKWKMGVSLEIRKGGGEEWQRVALLMGVTMLEQSRRRSGSNNFA